MFDAETARMHHVYVMRRHYNIHTTSMKRRCFFPEVYSSLFYFRLLPALEATNHASIPCRVLPNALIQIVVIASLLGGQVCGNSGAIDVSMSG